MFAVIAAPTKPVDYTHEWGNGSQKDLFDMKSAWQLAPGEARALHFWFTVGRGGEEKLEEALKALTLN